MDNFEVQNENRDFVIEDGVLVEYKGIGGDVVIPDCVVAIERYVFKCRNDLLSVTVPKGLRYIGPEAFCACANLKEVKVSEREAPTAQTEFVSVPPEDAWVVDAAFMGCGSLTAVEIPKGITGIDIAVFMNCPKLSSLTIPQTVTYIDKTAFDNISPIPFHKTDDAQNCDKEKEEGDFSVSIMFGIAKEPTKPVIYGFAGSYAEQFAKENGMTFKYNNGDRGIPND